MKLLTTNDILFKQQYGFRPKHSTIHPVIHLLNQCAEANNAIPSNYTLALFCDLIKAFDTFSHKALLHKLNTYWDTRGRNKWIESYLHNRSQYMEINSHESPKLLYTLPIILFLVYINNISNSMNGNCVICVICRRHYCVHVG